MTTQPENTGHKPSAKSSHDRKRNLRHAESKGLPEPALSVIEKFAARSPEEKEHFFLLFSKLLSEEVEEQRTVPGKTNAPKRKPDARESSERPRSRIVNGVRFVTVSKPGGTTIISNAPLGPPQKKSNTRS